MAQSRVVPQRLDVSQSRWAGCAGIVAESWHQAPPRQSAAQQNRDFSATSLQGSVANTAMFAASAADWHVASWSACHELSSHDGNRDDPCGKH